MKRSSPPAVCHVLILALLLFGSLGVGSTRAQGPVPPVQPDPVPSPQAVESTEYDAEILTTPPVVTAQEVEEDASAAVAAQPEIGDGPLLAIAAEQEPVSVTAEGTPAALQGIVKLDVSTPDEIRAGGYITYTYAYTNTGAAAATGIKLRATWTRFKPADTGGIDQYCDPPTTSGANPCDVLAGSLRGPHVQMLGLIAGGADYSIGDLAGGQSGRFSVLLRARSDVYPQANKSLVRPAGSGQLFLNGSNVPTSEDTAATLITGPVMVLSKRLAVTGKLLPTEAGTFVVTLGNATDHRDGTPVRADARKATNVVLTDIIPTGSEFISATGNPKVDTNRRTVTWHISSLEPDQTLEFQVTFRKLNVNEECRKLNNRTITVTSDEFPLKGSERYIVTGKGAAFDVLDPMVIRSIQVTPTNPVFGTDATLTIVIENYWNEPITRAQLAYSVQTNARYIPGSATPAASSTQPDGQITWVFDMAAGTKTTPSKATFSVRLQGGYTTQMQGGSVQIIAPSNVPSACIQSKTARVGLKPRLEISKTTPADPSTKIGNIFQVEYGQSFDYTIKVINNGITSANNVDITDLLPKEEGANFSYVEGSASIGGQRRDPTDHLDGQGGFILWRDLIVPAGATVELNYKLQVEGLRYQNYCNKISGVNGEEPITIKGASVCVKINPKVELTKSANIITAQPGDEVRFTLTLTNREPIMYRIGLFDALDRFEFVRQESGYGTPQQVDGGLIWPLTNVQPGQSISASIVVRVPNVCTTRDYVNEALFHNDEDSLIRIIPKVTAKVKVVCGVIDYSKRIDRAKVSLKDRIVYTLTIKNAGANPATNVVVEDLLPRELTFLSMDPSGSLKDLPHQSSAPGGAKLTWTIAHLATQQTVTIKFIALSGDIVGEFINQLTVPTGGRCAGSCAPDGSYSMQKVVVEPLITMEPQIIQTECASPGESRTYRLSIVNTNTHEYKDIQVRVKLPFGLTYARPLENTDAPTIEKTSDGISFLTWSSQRLAKGPAQKDFVVELTVGQVFGNLDTEVTTTSPDGTIPRKDGVSDPTVPVCAGSPAVFKDADRRLLRPGENLLYRITLVNTSNEPLTASIQDQLPVAFAFVENVLGPRPTSTGNLLSWDNLLVPAATEAGAGRLILQFRVREIAGGINVSYENTVKVIESSQELDTTYDRVSVMVVKDIFSTFLPMIRR